MPGNPYISFCAPEEAYPSSDDSGVRDIKAWNVREKEAEKMQNE